MNAIPTPWDYILLGCLLMSAVSFVAFICVVRYHMKNFFDWIFTNKKKEILVARIGTACLYSTIGFCVLMIIIPVVCLIKILWRIHTNAS